MAVPLLLVGFLSRFILILFWPVGIAFHFFLESRGLLLVGAHRRRRHHHALPSRLPLQPAHRHKHIALHPLLREPLCHGMDTVLKVVNRMIQSVRLPRHLERPVHIDLEILSMADESSRPIERVPALSRTCLDILSRLEWLEIPEFWRLGLHKPRLRD